jgi:hypothetical protein
VADFGISILLSAPTYTLTQIQLAQVYVDTQGRPFFNQSISLRPKFRRVSPFWYPFHLALRFITISRNVGLHFFQPTSLGAQVTVEESLITASYNIPLTKLHAAITYYERVDHLF